MLPKNRKPTHPGEILWEEFLEPKEMTQQEMAKKMGVPVQRVNTLINGKRGITPETALLLAGILGTTPQFWMNRQANHDLYAAQQEINRRAA